MFAVLGLRSLFFALSKVMGMFKYLKYGVSAILVLIGAKMLAGDYFKIPTSIALAVVAGVLAISIIASVALASKRT
jgi:tellurite resistance protein TerC